MLPCVWCQHSSGNMFTIHTVLQDGVSVFAVVAIVFCGYCYSKQYTKILYCFTDWEVKCFTIFRQWPMLLKNEGMID